MGINQNTSKKKDFARVFFFRHVSHPNPNQTNLIFVDASQPKNAHNIRKHVNKRL
jgi:hypothetical protein